MSWGWRLLVVLVMVSSRYRDISIRIAVYINPDSPQRVTPRVKRFGRLIIIKVNKTRRIETKRISCVARPRITRRGEMSIMMVMGGRKSTTCRVHNILINMLRRRCKVRRRRRRCQPGVKTLWHFKLKRKHKRKYKLKYKRRRRKYSDSRE